MDAFRTDAEIAFRGRARDYFLRRGAALTSRIPAAPERIWRELLSGSNHNGARREAGRPEVNEEVLAVDEASCFSPRLGLELMRPRISDDSCGPHERDILSLAGMAGAAAHVFDAGTRAARALGHFSSSLMGFRDVQERLASLVAGAEILRLGTIRACRLAGQGDRERGEAELGMLLEKGRSLVREARSLALGLLGEAWTRDHLPEDVLIPEKERTRS